MAFAILHCYPKLKFQRIAEVHVVYVCVIIFFISAVLPRSRTIAICPEGEKGKKLE